LQIRPLLKYGSDRKKERKPTISPSATLPLGDAVLLLAYLSIRILLQLQPEHYQFVNPIVLLEMSRLSLLLRSPQLLQAVNIGLLDTGGFFACPATHHNIPPSMDSINHALYLLMRQDDEIRVT
jgi:hypothetical protein